MRMQAPFEAYLDDYDRINVYISNTFFGGESRFFHLKNEKDEILLTSIQSRANLNNGYVHYVLQPQQPIVTGSEYILYDEHCKTTPLIYSHIVKTGRFSDEFSYGGDDLGPLYSPEEMRFKIWAPTAAHVLVHIKKDGRFHSFAMERKERGIFEAVLPGNWKDAKYTFMVRVNGQWKETIDPYSFFSGPNSQYSVVVDPNSLRLPEKVELPPLAHNTDAILYEASIRDMTSQHGAGQSHPGTFHAFTEENDITRTRQTGFSYLKTLGITHVQLMPVFDFGSVDETHPKEYYNWGYDPMQFRALEGSYSVDPRDAAGRVEEFAQMVQDLHREGIRVNLDLVFNHVYDKDSFALERMVPFYYFLMNQNGEFSNGSFCGNDIDSQPPMSRKYFLNTCKKIVQLFDVDGFRFDLMGILDVNLMNEIARECRHIKPGFMIYGEGWNMPSFVPEDLRASQQNQGKMPSVGHFSDRFRECIRGSQGNLSERGFASGRTDNLNEVMQVLTASCRDYRFDSPQKVINYVECHDNHTLWDKNRSACHGEGRELREKRQVMTNALVLLAQGVPFLHSGQEFGRTKQDIGNSYNRSDNYNRIDYFRRDRHIQIVKDTKALIQLRKDHPAFRLADMQEIWDNISFEVLDGQCLVYRTRKDEDSLAVFFNPTGGWFQYHMQQPGTVLFDNGQSNQEGSQNLILAPYSVVVYQIHS